jgi:hypothetical protein
MLGMEGTGMINQTTSLIECERDTGRALDRLDAIRAQMIAAGIDVKIRPEGHREAEQAWGDAWDALKGFEEAHSIAT